MGEFFERLAAVPTGGWPTSLPLDQIMPSAANPRRTFDPIADAELLESIERHGILTPLIVRPLPSVRSQADGDDGSGLTYELVAGHRRYAAAAELGLPQVPVVVRELSGAAALEAAIIENLQRKDLAPLDEAESYRALLDFSGSGETPASLAKRVGKTERHVWDRLQLLNLVPEAQDYLRRGRLPVEHAQRIAKLTCEHQERAVTAGNSRIGYSGGVWRNELALGFSDEDEREADPLFGLVPVTLRELDAWIAKTVRFDPAWSAGTSPLDFGATAARIDAAEAKPGRGRKVVSITHLGQVPPDVKGLERTYCYMAWKRADGTEHAPTCDRAVLGVVVCGPQDYGQAFEVCLDKACDVHWKQERLAAERRKKELAKQSAAAGRSGGPREEDAETSWERQEAERRRGREIWDRVRPHVEQVVLAACKKEKLTPALLRDMVEHNLSPDEFKRVEKALGKLTVQTLAAYWMAAESHQHLYNEHNAKAWLKETGIRIDLAPLMKAAEKALDAEAAAAQAKKAPADQATAKPAKKRRAA